MFEEICAAFAEIGFEMPPSGSARVAGGHFNKVWVRVWVRTECFLVRLTYEDEYGVPYQIEWIPALGPELLILASRALLAGQVRPEGLDKMASRIRAACA